MTFEEFFRKKKISLLQLKLAEPALFAEFETHYEAMGEKSFDHTKKYWFNKLRRLYILPPEPKIEKVIIENQIAEQTIVELLTEPLTEKPKVGFTPRFKTGAITVKTTELEPPVSAVNSDSAHSSIKISTGEPAKPKSGFTPRFKPGITATKTAGEKAANEPQANDEMPEIEKPASESKPAVGFKPRFKPPQK